MVRSRTERKFLLCLLGLVTLLAGLILSSACGRPQRGPAAEAGVSFVPPAFTLPPTATFVPTLNRKPTLTLTPTVTPTPIIHIVAKGEILGQIALDYGVSIEAIMLANGLKNAHLLSIGQRLIIPNEAMLAEMMRNGLDVGLPTPTPARPTPTLRPGSVPWNAAERYVGMEISAEGLVARTRTEGGDVYLYFHNPPETHLRIRIPAEAVVRFSPHPELEYLDHWVMVTGTVERVEGCLQIVVREPTQIELLE